MKPIIFSTLMVQAILEGRKTQTRRVIKLKYGNTHHEMRTDKYGTYLVEMENEIEGVHLIKNDDGTTTMKLLAYIEKKPRYQAGDILWVRETWMDIPEHFPENFHYRASSTPDDIAWLKNCSCKWRSGKYMPRAVARIFLRVTDVRAERVQDISPEDIRAEGFAFECDSLCVGPCEPIKKGGAMCLGYRPFERIWESLNAKRGYGWDTNPWVWAYTFERITKEEAERDEQND